jgi:hypothetical protein
MNRQLEVSQAEWDLLVELVEREQSELHPEIRRSRTTEMRDQLHKRLELVDQLLGRLRTVVSA